MTWSYEAFRRGGVLGVWGVRNHFLTKRFLAPRAPGIQFERQKEIHVFIEGEDVGLHRLDLVVEETIILELKAIKAFEDIHFAQLRSYLKATGLHVGLLLNFNAPTLVIKRVVL